MSDHTVRLMRMLRNTDRFDDPNLPGTIELDRKRRPVVRGTEIDTTQGGIAQAIPLAMCHLG